ncbi:SOS response-associated peptidase [Croceitalea sp. MTPC9]|uniref:SOS response-associated peptidase n=1 Tax=unclassified Croceitalea TaxID=2632280 RepID=UPI002B3BBE3D|nr:SOS response-associated peptidase [Croceitalea sp. MTPC6]GMN18566.1 SOS response-associated peptidase [Croceitalea sp. MTPC9]
MCFHARIVRTAEQLEIDFGVTRSEPAKEEGREFIYHHSNGYSHDFFWVIPQQRSTHMTPMMWGLLPYNKPGEDYEAYYKKAIPWGAGLNAQAEKLFDFWQYKHSALTKRCVIPLSGFYEPHTCEKPKNFKVPYYFEQKDSPIISLAGIYSITPDKYVTFSILTKEAPEGSKYAIIHNKKNRDGENRQVVPLAKNQIEEWLSDDLGEDDIFEIINNDLPQDQINAYSVSKDVFSSTVNSDYPEIIDKVEYPQVQIPY